MRSGAFLSRHEDPTSTTHGLSRSIVWLSRPIPIGGLVAGLSVYHDASVGLPVCFCPSADPVDNNGAADVADSAVVVVAVADFAAVVVVVVAAGQACHD